MIRPVRLEAAKPFVVTSQRSNPCWSGDHVFVNDLRIFPARLPPNARRDSNLQASRSLIHSPERCGLGTNRWPSGWSSSCHWSRGGCCRDRRCTLESQAAALRNACSWTSCLSAVRRLAEVRGTDPVLRVGSPKTGQGGGGVA